MLTQPNHICTRIEITIDAAKSFSGIGVTESRFPRVELKKSQKVLAEHFSNINTEFITKLLEKCESIDLSPWTRSNARTQHPEMHVWLCHTSFICSSKQTETDAFNKMYVFTERSSAFLFLKLFIMWLFYLPFERKRDEQTKRIDNIIIIIRCSFFSTITVSRRVF